MINGRKIQTRILKKISFNILFEISRKISFAIPCDIFIYKSCDFQNGGHEECVGFLVFPCECVCWTNTCCSLAWDGYVALYHVYWTLHVLCLNIDCFKFCEFVKRNFVNPWDYRSYRKMPSKVMRVKNKSKCIWIFIVNLQVIAVVTQSVWGPSKGLLKSKFEEFT